MTLNGRNVRLVEMKQCFGVHQKNLNKDRSIALAAKCRPMLLVSKNIKYVQIGAGVPSERGASRRIVEYRPTCVQIVLLNRLGVYLKRLTSLCKEGCSAML